MRSISDNVVHKNSQDREFILVICISSSFYCWSIRIMITTGRSSRQPPDVWCQITTDWVGQRGGLLPAGSQLSKSQTSGRLPRLMFWYAVGDMPWVCERLSRPTFQTILSRVSFFGCVLSNFHQSFINYLKFWNNMWLSMLNPKSANFPTGMSYWAKATDL